MIGSLHLMDLILNMFVIEYSYAVIFSAFSNLLNLRKSHFYLKLLAKQLVNQIIIQRNISQWKDFRVELVEFPNLSLVGID